MMRQLFTLVLMLSTTTLFAQSIDWQKSYGGSKSEQSNSIQQTDDGGYIMAGRTLSDDKDVSNNNGGADAWLIKLTASGGLDWERNYGGSKWERFHAVQQTSDGGYILTGRTESSDHNIQNQGEYDLWVVKVDNQGSLVWQKTYGGSADESGADIQQTADGGYIVVGYTASNNGDVSGNHGGQDCWVLKLDDQGEIDWEKAIGGSDDDAGRAIQITNDGGFIIMGSSKSSDGNVSDNYGATDVWIVKLGASGNTEWEKNYGGSADEKGVDIKQIPDGGFIAIATTRSNDNQVSGNQGGRDLWVIKLDNQGSLDWQKTYGGSDDDYGHSIDLTNDGGYILAGETASDDGDIRSGNHGGLSDAWVVKIDKNGSLQWESVYGGSKFDSGSEIHQTQGGDFILGAISGSTDGDVSGNNGGFDFWAVKIENPAPDAGEITGDDDVCVNESTTLSSNGASGGDWSSDNTTVATVDNTGKVTGVSEGVATISYKVSNNYGSQVATFDMTVNNCTGIEEAVKSKNVNTHYNTANQKVNLWLEGLSAGNYQVRIYNSVGRLMLKDNIELNQNKEQFSFDMAAFSDGLYFIKVIGHGQQYGSRFVKR